MFVRAERLGELFRSGMNRSTRPHMRAAADDECQQHASGAAANPLKA
jgi:hypothetical protein